MEFSTDRIAELTSTAKQGVLDANEWIRNLQDLPVADARLEVQCKPESADKLFAWFRDRFEKAFDDDRLKECRRDVIFPLRKRSIESELPALMCLIQDAESSLDWFPLNNALTRIRDVTDHREVISILANCCQSSERQLVTLNRLDGFNLDLVLKWPCAFFASEWLVRQDPISRGTARHYNAWKKMRDADPTKFKKLISGATKRIGGVAKAAAGKGLRALPLLGLYFSGKAAIAGYHGQGHYGNGFIGATHEVSRDFLAADLWEWGFMSGLDEAYEYLDLDDHDHSERLQRYYPITNDLLHDATYGGRPRSRPDF